MVVLLDTAIESALRRWDDFLEVNWRDDDDRRLEALRTFAEGVGLDPEQQMIVLQTLEDMTASNELKSGFYVGFLVALLAVSESDFEMGEVLG